MYTLLLHIQSNAIAISQIFLGSRRTFLPSGADIYSLINFPELFYFGPYIKPDEPINVYARFCLFTAKSKFSLISPVAD